MHSIFLQTLLLIDPLVDALGSPAVGTVTWPKVKHPSVCVTPHLHTDEATPPRITVCVCQTKALCDMTSGHQAEMFTF